MERGRYINMRCTHSLQSLVYLSKVKPVFSHVWSSLRRGQEQWNRLSNNYKNNKNNNVNNHHNNNNNNNNK